MSVLVLMEDGTAGDDGPVSLSSVPHGPHGPGSWSRMLCEPTPVLHFWPVN